MRARWGLWVAAGIIGSTMKLFREVVRTPKPACQSALRVEQVLSSSSPHTLLSPLPHTSCLHLSADGKLVCEDPKILKFSPLPGFYSEAPAPEETIRAQPPCLCTWYLITRWFPDRGLGSEGLTKPLFKVLLLWREHGVPSLDLLCSWMV